MVLMSVALMSISPVMAENNDDVMVISENSQAKKVDDIIIIDDGTMLGMPNPIKDFDTIEEAQKSLSFDTKVPENVPEKYKAVAFETISDKILQVVYNDGKNEVTYRTAQGTEDITGDYNKYAYTKKLKINGADVTIKGNGTKVYNVLCTKNDVTYSIFARQGISLSEIKIFLNKQEVNWVDKLTEVVDKYGNMVYRLAISYLKNTHDAQDIVQEVFIKYYNNEGKIQSEEHLKSWLLRVTINLCKIN